MARSQSISLFPYLLPSPEALEVGDWKAGFGGGDDPLDFVHEKIHGWSADRNIRLETNAWLDVDMVIEQCKLHRSPGIQMELVAVLRCPATQYGICLDRAKVDLEAGEMNADFRGVVESSMLAERIKLTVELLVTHPGSDPSTLTPQQPCSRLLESDPVVITLEGIGGQFPMQARDFNDLHMLGPNRLKMLWYLDIGDCDLNGDILGGSVRVLLNTMHPDYPHLKDVTSPAIASIVGTDIATQLVQRLAAEEEYDLPEGGEWGETSVGGVARNLADIFFGKIDHRDLKERIRRKPGLVAAHAQSHLEIRMYDSEGDG